MIKHKIIKNSVFLLSSSIVNRILKFSLIPLAVTELGAEKYGVFNYAISLLMLFYMFTDIGVQQLFNKEYPNRDNNPDVIHILTSIRIFLLIVFSLSGFSLYFLVQDVAVRSILFVIHGYLFFESGTKICHMYLQSSQQMGYLAFSEFLSVFVTTAVGVGVLYQYHDLYLFSLAYFIGSIVGFIFSYSVTRKLISFRFVWDWPLIRHVWNQLVPFIVTLVASVFILVADSLMIKWFLGLNALGVYKAMLKLSELTIIPGLLFLKAVSPVMSQLAFKPNLNILTKKTVATMFLYGIAVVVGIMCLSNDVIVSIYSQDFSVGRSTFVVLGLLVMITPMLSFINYLLLVHNIYKESMMISLGASVLNIILNLVLIPKFFILGAAIATVITQCIDIGLSTYLYVTRVRGISFPIQSIVKGVLASAGMYIVLNYASFLDWVVLKIAIGATSYALFLFIFKEPYFRETIGVLSTAIQMKLSRDSFLK